MNATNQGIPHLDEATYQEAYKESLDPRQAKLLDWAKSAEDNVNELLQWLGGDFPIYSLEDPMLAIIRALPPVNCRVEPDVRRVLAERLALVLRGLASDEGLRNKTTSAVWSELINLIDRLNDPNVFAPPLLELLSAFDRHGLPSAFLKYEVLMGRFTETLMHVQKDNSLERRWLKQIEQDNGDPILRCDMFTAIRGLLGMPNQVSQETMDQLLKSACNRIEAELTEKNAKKEMIEDLLGMVFKDYTRYTHSVTPSLASVWDQYSWITVMVLSDWLRRTSEDPAVITNLNQISHLLNSPNSRELIISKTAANGLSFKDYWLRKQNEDIPPTRALSSHGSVSQIEVRSNTESLTTEKQLRTYLNLILNEY